ncbi:unnamed protein product [Pleuronectes platessa]|uniref:Uncharacterized protein n=1 Tax=Pleuronectes platessa TaxID=8262 RepID=A0A9N7Y7P8_PLEPL|nr:unnamed protein product [Pleuronectes platessa]
MHLLFLMLCLPPSMPSATGCDCVASPPGPSSWDVGRYCGGKGLGEVRRGGGTATQQYCYNVRAALALLIPVRSFPSGELDRDGGEKEELPGMQGSARSYCDAVVGSVHKLQAYARDGIHKLFFEGSIFQECVRGLAVAFA